jgi:hypothetical protein
MVLVPTTTTTTPRVAVDVMSEPITLGHMTLFHANVQISNYSARTIYTLMRRAQTPLLMLCRSTRSSLVIHIFIPFHGRDRRRASPSRSVSPAAAAMVAPSVL